MRTSLILAWLLFYCLCLLPSQDKERNNASLKNLQENFQSISRKTQPHIVQIRADNEEPEREQKVKITSMPNGVGQYFQPQARKNNLGLGSGFMINPAGLIVTNNHVVENANRFFVRLADKTEVEATLVGVNEELDIAVLKIPAKYCDPINWADSSGVKAGNIVFAFGSPFGLQNTVTKGIVSAIGRAGWQEENMHYIQTDAAINSGNSGGPLVDLNGNVIGINTWILSPAGVSSGLGFALPSNIAKVAIENLLTKDNKATWLGIIPQQGDSAEKGVAILGVLPNSPAEKAGLKPGDRLTRFNGNRLDSKVYLKVLLDNAFRHQKLIINTETSPYRVELNKLERPNNLGLIMPLKDEKLITRTSDETLSLFNEVATLRVCYCDKKNELLHCPNCTSAKNDMSYLLRMIRIGYSKEKIIRLMDSPIVITAWLDLSDKESIRVYQIIKKLTTEMSPFLRIQLRHFPSSYEISSTWKEQANIFEVLRIMGLEEEFLNLLCTKPDFESSLDALFVLHSNAKAQVSDSLNVNHFSEQIMKDLKDGPFQYGIKTAPAILLNLDLVKEELDEKSIKSIIHKLLLKHSL